VIAWLMTGVGHGRGPTASGELRKIVTIRFKVEACLWAS
jgi:hypothetical protein